MNSGILLKRDWRSVELGRSDWINWRHRFAAESEATVKESAFELERKKLAAELDQERLADQVEDRRLDAELDQKKLEDRRLIEDWEADLKNIETENQGRIRLRELDARLVYEN